MTTGSTDLAQMLATLEATARPDTYVYTVVEPDHPVLVVAQVTVQEERGLTAVIRKQDAQTHNLDYEFECAWLTLTVHSSLEAVGLTAAFSTALGNAGISCNVIAGFYHDHLLVPVADKDRALAVLAELRNASTV